jgi:large subunit ribosomal protein L11
VAGERNIVYAWQSTSSPPQRSGLAWLIPLVGGTALAFALQKKQSLLAVKEETSSIKLIIPAGKASPAPPIGPALGSKGLNIMEFCKGFNARKQEYEAGTPIPVVITAKPDRSFTFETKLPTASWYIKKATGVSKGINSPKIDKPVGVITAAQCREIAEKKLPDMNATTVEAAARTIKGSAISMGFTYQED